MEVQEGRPGHNGRPGESSRTLSEPLNFSWSKEKYLKCGSGLVHDVYLKKDGRQTGHLRNVLLTSSTTIEVCRY